MSRSDWSILATLAGLTALFVAFGLGSYVTALNYPEEQRYQSYRYTPEQPQQVEAAAAGQSNAQPLQYRAPCHQPEGQTESDLCAQWRAAKAAENSAFWTKWGVWIAVIGSSLLLWQIALTRKAVEDTGEATDAMREANRIAKHISALELRPYVWFGKIEIRDVVLGKIPQLVVEVCHAGQTPAYEVRSFVCFTLLSPGIDNAKIRFDQTVKSAVPSKTQLFPGHEGLLAKQTADRPLVEGDMRLLAVQGQRFIGAGIVSYRDIFGKRHLTTFKCVSTFFVTNDILETAPTNRGNHSS